MTDEHLVNDVERAHAVLDLCDVKTRTHGDKPMPLHFRVLILAQMAGKQLTQEQVTEKVQARAKSN
jgi:hypothetical protein